MKATKGFVLGGRRAVDGNDTEIMTDSDHHGEKGLKSKS